MFLFYNDWFLLTTALNAQVKSRSVCTYVIFWDLLVNDSAACINCLYFALFSVILKNRYWFCVLSYYIEILYYVIIYSKLISICWAILVVSSVIAVTNIRLLLIRFSATTVHYCISFMPRRNLIYIYILTNIKIKMLYLQNWIDRTDIYIFIGLNNYCYTNHNWVTSYSSLRK